MESENLPDSVKRKRLEELFSEDPFLSPTMRARVIQDRLSQDSAESRETLEAALSVERSLPNELRLSTSIQLPTETPIEVASPPRLTLVRPEPKETFNDDPLTLHSAAPISFSTALEYFRGVDFQGTTHQIKFLEAFRDQTLKAWVRFSPKQG